MTRFDSFLKANGIGPRLLAAESQVSRQHIYRLRLGRAEPTRRMMTWLAQACGRILRREVRTSELFDLGEDPLVEMVEAVTTAHGEAFADGVIDFVTHCLEISDVAATTGIMRWPQTGTEAQAWFIELEDEIIQRTFESLRKAIAAAYVTAANRVLERERKQ